MFIKIDVRIESIVLNQGLSRRCSSLRLVDNSPCNVTIGIAGDGWVATVLSFLAMTLAAVGFVNVSVYKVFIMPGDKGEPVDWPIVPRLIDLIVEYRVLRLCSGHGLAYTTPSKH